MQIERTKSHCLRCHEIINFIRWRTSRCYGVWGRYRHQRNYNSKVDWDTVVSKV